MDFHGCQQSSQPRIMKVARRSFDTSDIGKNVHEGHLRVNPRLLAQQITLIELELFQAIQPEELTSLKWNGKEKLKHAPNIVASTRWFNKIIFWVQKDILHEKNRSSRADVVSHFVRIAKKLVDMNNYYSAMAIVSSLQIQCIYRLSATWAALSSRDRSTFQKLVELYSQESNFSNLRTAVGEAQLPCIPYLGLYLSDLTYIDVAADSVTQSGTSGSWNEEKKQERIGSILQQISMFQQSDYGFRCDCKISSYLKSQTYIEELQRFIEDANYKQSLRLEPANTDGLWTNGSKSETLLNADLDPSFDDVQQLSRRHAVIPTNASYDDLIPVRATSPSFDCKSLNVLHPTTEPIRGKHRESCSGEIVARSLPMFTRLKPHSAGNVRTRSEHRGDCIRQGGGRNNLPTPGTLDDRIQHLQDDDRYSTSKTTSWSTSSESSGYSPSVMDQVAPVQPPLSSLLNQTDGANVPTALSSVYRISKPSIVPPIASNIYKTQRSTPSPNAHRCPPMIRLLSSCEQLPSTPDMHTRSCKSTLNSSGELDVGGSRRNLPRKSLQASRTQNATSISQPSLIRPSKLSAKSRVNVKPINDDPRSGRGKYCPSVHTSTDSREDELSPPPILPRRPKSRSPLLSNAIDTKSIPGFE